ncbi:MAG: hypothetical protein Q8N00_13005 [Nitrospirota bacterium]|nr:hypothetical protein [Nitrospirota bacterium]MDP3596773.1 hypothetical protein [Nitrospirota bacterium]
MSFRRSLLASPQKLEKLWQRHLAQRKLQKAVAAGKVKKPIRCQRCRKRFPKQRLQGHHHDYRKPFDVEWYCQACHYKKHPSRFQAKAAYRQMQRLSGIIGH